MRRPQSPRSTTLLIAFVAVAALLGGCASSDASDTGTDSISVTKGMIGEQPDGGDPVSVGTLSYATLSGITSLDPADRQDSGATGGSEMAAIYDLLMRYDTVTGKYVPQLARSLEANENSSVWTLSLRQDAQFSDGSPVNSEAVIWSINRYVDENGLHAQIWKESVADMTATDPSTVTFTLNRPWRDFPIMLTSGPGMIVAPSSMASGTFNAVGAGPFVVEKYAPQTVLSLTANPGYWDGKPLLKNLDFPVIQGEQQKLDALHNGDIDAAYVRRADSIHSALGAGDIGYINTVNMAAVGMINQREGRAASDPRVRKAIVAAIDPETYNERAESGKGLPGSDMFQSWSVWHGDVPADGYDPETAKKYLAEAKADGYDGKITYVTTNNAQTQKNALAYKTLMESVGFTVAIEYTPTIGDYISRLYVNHDFDVAHAGMSVLDEAPFVRLYGNFHSNSASNILGYRNPKMDALLDRLQSASTDNEKRALLGDVQALVNETAPAVTLGAGKVLVTWRQNVHDITPSADEIMLFDDAWVDSTAAG